MIIIISELVFFSCYFCFKKFCVLSTFMSAIQSVTLAVEVVATVLIICCVTLPYWKVNDPEDTIRDNIQRVRPT